MDLITRLSTIALLSLLAAPARAQNLLPDRPLLSSPPLTTLLQPQRLDRSKPLLPQDAVRTPGTPCQRPATGSEPRPATPAASRGRAATGGSGPGEYGRYIPGAAASGANPSAAVTNPTGTGSAAPADKPAAPGSSTPASSARGVDKPLYGGIDRPLWNTGEQRAPLGSNSTVAGDKAATATLNPDSAAALPRDRPLWEDGSSTQPGAQATGAQTTGAAAIAAAGLGLLPCSTNPVPLVR